MAPSPPPGDWIGEASGTNDAHASQEAGQTVPPLKQMAIPQWDEVAADLQALKAQAPLFLGALCRGGRHHGGRSFARDLCAAAS